MQPTQTPSTDMEMHHDPEAKEKVFELIEDVRFAMFGTYDARGVCHSRPMARLDREGDALWFFTSATSRKIGEIARDSRVTLDFADASSQTYVSLTGTAEIIDDRARIEELWSEPLRTWFPDGKDDPDIRAVLVVPDTAEYWDTTSSSLVYAYGYLKARMTGEAPRPGDVGQVAM